jgi:hypothetical protein
MVSLGGLEDDWGREEVLSVGFAVSLFAVSFFAASFFAASFFAASFLTKAGKGRSSMCLIRRGSLA